MLTILTVLTFCILLGIAFYADCELGRLRDDINQLTGNTSSVSEHLIRFEKSKRI
ncbi:hypothetical protein [Bacillus sp. NPDC094106]|uniref:hypothetical protein n=1 Tax=Bacillus sp. NPDC094106 TaxID=3363949 RepID=UPI0038285973